MSQEEAAAAVELYQDEAGGLYIFPEGEENGFYMTGDVPGGLFRNDARDIVGGHTEFWRAYGVLEDGSPRGYSRHSS